MEIVKTVELSQPEMGTIRVVNGVYSTKVCRKCGCKDLIELRSIERKRCANCRRLIHWPLTEGQKPLL